MSSQTAEQSQGQPIETDVLIIGAGPAGASLASFLASYGVKGIMVSRDSTSAETPRAHITNMATFECFRDIGLEDILRNVSIPIDETDHLLRWCLSMSGRELARRYTLQTTPQRTGEYKIASPCEHMDLPQTRLEPELVRFATLNGFQVRWDTEFRSMEQGDSRVTVDLFDKVTQQIFSVSAKYVFGADGAGSRVMRHLQMPMEGFPSTQWAVNVFLKADLSHLMKSRPAVLSWVLQPHRDHADFNMVCVVRMVKQWDEWVFSFLPAPGAKEELLSKEQYLEEIQQVIGDDTRVEITHMSRWRINEAYAAHFSVGRVFCLGDAVHRHPPAMGLGSNTSVQDSYNLAWKVAYVLQNKASPRLLDSYSLERQPVGKHMVTRTNQALRRHVPIFELLGLVSPSIPERLEALSLLSANSKTGEQRRTEFQAATDACVETELNGLGIEFNQDYSDSPVICADTSDSAPVKPALGGNPDPIRFHTRTTIPGWRLPHVWLNKAVPEKEISTIDLAGKGKFALFTGIGGGVWKEAAAKLSADLNVPIRTISIGYGQDFEDLYGDWARIRGVESSGAVLVRPDNFVAWRHGKADGDETWAVEKLSLVMRKVLALDN
ncbi:unnamed protein product [Clonostachys rhizophaga]|uniref:FAD-binding domain-containing protein n=1 Tax=Clonostachys rhizophaga TaxID=160324 RepID=A0A9N9VNA6_9HYPO|nr:unnamed protein product [Clonostachys rhizophaga]